MDDWNDFGAVPPPNPRHLPPSQPDFYEPLPHSPASSSVSESSVANLNDDDDDPDPDPDHRSASSVTQRSVSPTAPSLSASLASNTTRERSFLPSFPFLKPRRDRTTSSSEDSMLPPVRSQHPDRALDPVNDQISAGSESDTHEPQSVRMPPTKVPTTLNPPVRAPRNRADIEDPIPPPPPRQGDLDDVPDDYELNSEGFRLPPMSSDSSDGGPSLITSSLLRHPDKSYIKLEVISAKEVRSLLVFFNWFIIAAFLYTILLLIAANTAHASVHEMAIAPQFLTEEQKHGAVLIPKTLGPQLLTRMLFHSTADPQFSSPSSHAIFAKCRPPCNALHPPNSPITASSRSLIRPRMFGPLTSSMRQQPGQSDTVDEDALEIPPDGAPALPDGIEQDPEFDADALPGLIPVEYSDDINPDEYIFLILERASVLPRAYKFVSHFSNLFLALFFFVLSILFAIRVFSEGKRRTTHEQIWVLVLMLSTSLYFSAFESIIRVFEELNKEVHRRFAAWVFRIEDVFTVLREASFAVVTFFYLWANLHSYRILDPLKRLTFRGFYLPKLLILAPLSVFMAITYTVIPVLLTEIPLFAAPVFAFLFSEFRIIPALRAELAAAIVKSIVDLVLLIIIVFEAKKTFKVLEEAPYMKHRTKRVGFRFFLYINFVYYVLFFILQFMLLFGKPKGDNLVTLNPEVDIVHADLFHFWNVGPNILLTGYVLVTAYVHLPRTSVGVVRGWFLGSKLAKSSSTWSRRSEEDSDGMTSVTRSADDDITRSTIAKKAIWSADHWLGDDDSPSSLDNDTELQQQIVEPVTYRMRESKDNLQIKANCFTMQTHVIMFNFAWYVYYYGTSKFDKFRPKENPLPFNFRIQTHAKCEATDTQALVVDCTDRIIVTFKGTTSKRNVRTSLHMSHHRLPEVVYCNSRGEDESSRLKRLFGARYTHGKLHRGFAAAYLSIADELVRHVQILREQKARPVFLTGHSLGGALATICSLDLWVKLNLSRREIFVSTFGSPRVGNMNFQEVYDQVVPLHWRIVVDPDMITKMPFNGYKHVGKKVVLTAQGDMLIDRTALERRPWTGEAAGFAYHRKAAYLLAMRAWCTRHHGMTYTPVFWPFPVRQEDRRRFAGAFEQSESSERVEIANRIASINAMVDQLGKTEDERVNMAVVEKWARLTRYKMLKEQLQTRRVGR